MQPSIVQVVLLALLTGICGVDMFDGLTHIHRPIVSGLLVGMILGNVQVGLITGATLELVWMGQVPIAGAQPQNIVVGGIIGTAFAIIAGQDASVSIGIAVPFAIGVQALITLYFTIMTPFMHKADDYAANADTAGIEKINYLGLLILFAFYFIIGFLAILVGGSNAEAISNFFTNAEWLTNSLSAAGGMMPAIGFAILMKIMLKKEYLIFLFLGFAMIIYLNLDLFAVAIFGVILAVYDFTVQKSKGEGVEAVAKGGESDGI